MKKVYSSAEEALGGLSSANMFVAEGGFGLCGIPEMLLQAIYGADGAATEATIV